MDNGDRVQYAAAGVTNGVDSTVMYNNKHASFIFRTNRRYESKIMRRYEREMPRKRDRRSATVSSNGNRGER